MRTLVFSCAATITALSTAAAADEAPSGAGSSLDDRPPPIVTAPVAPSGGHFEFGSYGRVRAAIDLRGHTGSDANIVSHGDRIDEDSYAELELRREDTFTSNVATKVVATLALFPPFFHFSGDPTQAIAVRNLYAQGALDDLTLWAGSRMYRGDDIYLLDWWPLDNENTLGGGIGYRLRWNSGAETLIAAHTGVQRLSSTYQYEQIPAPLPAALTPQQGPTSTNITSLDRPRTVETFKVTHLATHPGRTDGLKFVLYAETQELPAGVYTDTTVAPPGQTALPAEWGWLAGAEAAYFTGRRNTFVQVFVRHAEGIAAYDPLSVPLTFASDRTTRGSSETLAALGANYENGPFGLLVGGYFRSFRDGSSSPTTSQKYDEGVVALRPQLYLGDRWGLAFEGAFEARRYALLDPQTDQPLTAVEWRAGVIPYFSPSGRGSYARPQLRLIYAVTARNSGAQELFPTADTINQRGIVQFLALGAEWWFNSSSYP